MGAITVKIGQSFVVTAAISAADGSPVDLAAYTVSSQIRDALGTLVDTLMATLPVGRPGVVTLWSSDGTAAWPGGRLFCDLKFVRADGVIQFSETFPVSVTGPITTGAAT